MAGAGLGQTMGIAFAEGALGSAVSQQILEEEIDWTRVIVDGAFSSVMEGVLWKVRNPGGVTEGPGNISKEVLENGKKIISFKNEADPIREIVGKGSESHPKEWHEIMTDLEKNGVEINYREGGIAYGPGSRAGQPGSMVMDPEASMSALQHEYNHFSTAKSKGFPSSAQAFQDWEGWIADEVKSYNIEIKIAEDLGLDNVANQLKKNLRDEIEYITNNFSPLEP